MSDRSSIVLVEDSETDVFLVKEALAVHHLDVDLQILEDGEQGIGFISALDVNENAPRPQLFLLDLNLPKTSGLAVLACLKRSKRCANVPVVIMTSSDAESDRSKTEALGATAYFIKPSGYDAFLQIGTVIHELLRSDDPTKH